MYGKSVETERKKRNEKNRKEETDREIEGKKKSGKK